MTTSAIGASLLPAAPRVQVQEATAKVCPRCGIQKPADGFYRKAWTDRRRGATVVRHGLSSYCRACTQEVSAARHARPEVAARKREQARERAARRTDAARERERAYIAAWQATHREECRAYQRAYAARRKAAGLPPRGAKALLRCRDCQQEKPRAEFPRPQGRRCAACMVADAAQTAERRRAYSHTYYEKHRTAVQAAQRARYVARREAEGKPTPGRRVAGYWTCPRCKERKPRASFGARRGAACAECRAERAARVPQFASRAARMQAYYQAHREERLAYQRAYAVRRRQQAEQREGAQA